LPVDFEAVLDGDLDHQHNDLLALSGGYSGPTA